MPYNPSNVPDAPLPISMLPDAEALTDGDLLLITQPSNITSRSRRLRLSQLLGSQPVITSPKQVVSNILTWQGSLPSARATAYQKVAEIQVGLNVDVEFHCWGGSTAPSGDNGTFYCGLTGRVVQIYGPSDVEDESVLDKSVYAGTFQKQDTMIVQNVPMVYDAVFHNEPVIYNQIQGYPEYKVVSLYLAAGCSMNLYQLTPPDLFTLKIQAKLTRTDYQMNLLTAVTGG